jgi:hypothetical protein
MEKVGLNSLSVIGFLKPEAYKMMILAAAMMMACDSEPTPLSDLSEVSILMISQYQESLYTTGEVSVDEGLFVAFDWPYDDHCPDFSQVNVTLNGVHASFQSGEMARYLDGDAGCTSVGEGQTLRVGGLIFDYSADFIDEADGSAALEIWDETHSISVQTDDFIFHTAAVTDLEAVSDRDVSYTFGCSQVTDHTVFNPDSMTLFVENDDDERIDLSAQLNEDGILFTFPQSLSPGEYQFYLSVSLESMVEDFWGETTCEGSCGDFLNFNTCDGVASCISETHCQASRTITIQ